MLPLLRKTASFLHFLQQFLQLSGIFMIGAGSAVIVEEKTHATISTSLPIQRAPIVLLVAGILSLIDGIVWAVLLCCWIQNANFCDLKKTVAVVRKLFLFSGPYSEVLIH